MRYRFVLYASMAFAVIPTLLLGSWVAFSLAIFPVGYLRVDSPNRLLAFYILVWLVISGIIALPLTGIFFLVKAVRGGEN
jgi:hypothetical protein